MVPVELRPLEDLVPLLRMWTACFLAPQVPFLHQLLGAKSASHRVFSDSEDDAATADAAADATADAAADATADESAESAESAESDGMSPSLDSLNLLQKEAVTKILSGGLLRRCHLLQGPPGTGKTRAVVALLQQLSLQRADLDNRILVSAPSNGAVQVALEHFLKTEEAQRTSLCLAGVDERVPSEGPLRAAFIHTRMQYTLALLLKCEKDPTALPEAVQALESLRQSAPSVYRRLQLPPWRLTPTELQHAWEKKVEGSESDSEETSTTRRSALRSAVEVPSRSGSAVEEKQMCWIVLGDHLQERLRELARRERWGEADFETEQRLRSEAATGGG
ncbi:unnamed protein product [Durusdinium trenchii]|uniref:DNA2/NAM7 helicase helicase domain-containing protein n=1 Tax=Durusdinium trenchii TaxID=1381693 RepID=A0ABP0RGS6_9DINO